MLIISIKNIDKKMQHTHARNRLRECLRKLNIPENAEISQGAHGKPFLTSYPVYFNLSHADGIAACITADTECGIDCEKVRSFPPRVMKRVFSENELRLAEKTPAHERDLMFFRLWTLKEAFVKAIGRGISYPMKTVEFSFAEDRIITGAKGFTFKQYIIHGEYVVSIAVEQKSENF